MEKLKNTPLQEKEIRKPKFVTTARGSVYTYMEDGKTQRFKSVEQETKEPQDVLVYIPNIANLHNWEHYKKLPEWFKEYPNAQIMEILAGNYVHNKNKRVLLVNESHKIIRDNQEAASAEKLFLFFIDKNSNETEFALPVTTEPNIGSTTFDARFYKDNNDKDLYSCHIGNEVIDIEY